MPDGDPGFREVLKIREVRATVVGTFVIMLGFGVLLPVLPAYARTFDVGYDAVGLLIAGFNLTRLLADPFVGRLIDRYGERATTAAGAIIVGASSIAAGLAPTFALLVVFRSVGGIGSSLFFAALLSFLLRTIPSERSGRVMSVYYGSFNVGLIAGGPLGGVVARLFGLASPLHVYGVACFASAILFWRTIHNPARSAEETRAGALRRLPWTRPFVAVLAANAAYAWMIGALFSTLIPLFGVEEVGLTLGGVGVALAIVTATELASLFPAGKATDRRGRRAVLVPSLAALAAMTAVLGLASAPTPFMLAMAALGVTSGFAGVPPAPMLSDVTPDELKGTAVAAFRFVGDLGFVLGPLVAGWAANAFGFGPSFLINAAPTLVALALVLSIRETMPSMRVRREAGL